MKHPARAITTAVQLYFSGESLRNTAKSLRLMGVQVTHQAVYNWIRKYMALMDDETRYWIAKRVAGEKHSKQAIDYASGLFRDGREVAGRKPLVLITDGLHAYDRAFKREFNAYRDKYAVQHMKHVTWKGEGPDNRKMERFNGEIRDREKVMRSLKREDSPILTGYQLFHNFVRPHMGLNGKTPAEVAGIEAKGDDKWLTLIQNATHPTKVAKQNEPTTT